MAKKGYGSKGDVMAGGAGMSPRKAMAGAMAGAHEASMGGENFGVESFAEGNNHAGHHPDHVAATGAMDHLADHERGAGPAIHHTRHHHPAQAAPHHGPHHPDGYMHHQHAEHPTHHKHRGG